MMGGAGTHLLEVLRRPEVRTADTATSILGSHICLDCSGFCVMWAGNLPFREWVGCGVLMSRGLKCGRQSPGGSRMVSSAQSRTDNPICLMGKLRPRGMMWCVGGHRAAAPMETRSPDAPAHTLGLPMWDSATTSGERRRSSSIYREDVAGGQVGASPTA